MLCCNILCDSVYCGFVGGFCKKIWWVLKKVVILHPISKETRGVLAQ